METQQGKCRAPWGLDKGNPGYLGLLVKVNMHRIKHVMELVLVDCRLCALGDRDLCREAGRPGEGQLFFYYLNNF